MLLWSWWLNWRGRLRILRLGVDCRQIQFDEVWCGINVSKAASGLLFGAFYARVVLGIDVLCRYLVVFNLHVFLL